MAFEMPVLRPVAIPTKSQPLWVRIWRWITWVRRWSLVNDWHYEMVDPESKEGDRRLHVIIPKEFRFDGASIPRPLWGLLSPIGLLLVPGLLHDYAYRYDYLWVQDQTTGEIYRFREGAGQKYWDKLFREVGTDVNGMAIIDMLAWAALAAFGSFAWKKNRKNQWYDLYPEGVEPDRQ